MMKWFAWICALCIGMVVCIASAATGPTTAPVVDVLVLPFTALGNQPTAAWIPRAVQQNLMADLARGRFHPAQQQQSPIDAAAARAAGRAVGARYVIFGTYQSVDLMLRFDGQVLEVKSGNIVGGLSETAAPRDLFSLEDSLSNQAVQTLRRLTAPSPATPAVAAAPASPPARPIYVRPYQGSELQAYINANRTPSTDYGAQYRASYDRQNYWSYSYGSYWPYYPYYGYYYPANYFTVPRYYSYALPGYYPYSYGFPLAYVTLHPQTPIYFSTDRTSH